MEESAIHQERPQGHPTRRACTFCQNRHLKCDGVQPCHQCERRGKECVFAASTYTKRTASSKKVEVEDPNATMETSTLSSEKWQMRTSDESSDPVFALDGEDGVLSQDAGAKTFRRKKRNRPNSYLDDDDGMKQDADGRHPGRYALPAAAQAYLASSSSQSSNMNMKPVVLGGQDMRHQISDTTLDASAALSQLSNSHVRGVGGQSDSSSSPNTIHSHQHQQSAFSSKSLQNQVSNPSSLGVAHKLVNLVPSSSNSATMSMTNTPMMQQQNNQSVSSKSVAATSAWMMAFAQGVSPFTSVAAFAPLDTIELQNILTLDSHQLCNLPLDVLARALMQCAMLAHGSRYTGNLEHSAQHGHKAWQLVKVVMGKKRAHGNSTSAQIIVCGLELLTYYFIGSADFFKLRVIVALAYHVYIQNRKYLSDATAHRVLGMMIGQSTCLEDIEYWLSKAKALNLQAGTPFETSGWVTLALYLTTSIIGVGDTDPLPIKLKNLTDKEVAHKLACLQVIDESEKAVTFFEATPACSSDSNNIAVCKIHRAVLNGCRCVILWQCGYDNEAANCALKVVSAGKPESTSRLPHLIVLSHVAQVARYIGQRAIYQKCLEFLLEGVVSYPYIRFLHDELSKPATGDGTSNSHDDGTVVIGGIGGDMMPDETSMAMKTVNLMNPATASSSASTSSPFTRTPMNATTAAASNVRWKSFHSKLDSISMSPREDDGNGGQTVGGPPLRPNPMKVTTVPLLSRSSAQSVSPQMTQSVSPQMSISPNTLQVQGVSPHLQGLSPLTAAQGLSPFALPGIVPSHLLPIQQFSPQLGFIGVGTFSPGQAGGSSPGSWNTAGQIPSDYLMDTTDHNQWH